MEFWETYAEEWVIVNGIAVLVFLASYLRPRLGRLLFFLLFTWASLANYFTASLRPEVYLDYAELTPFTFLKLFIKGWFANHIWLVVSSIAAVQILMAIGFLLRGWGLQMASIAAMIFFFAIAPLGIGSGFPSSLIAAAAVYFILKRGGRDFIWKR